MRQLELTEIKRYWIEDAIAQFCGLNFPAEFTAEILHERLPCPEHHNWWGCLCAALKGRGLIKKVGYRTSQRKESNGRVVAVWKRI